MQNFSVEVLKNSTHSEENFEYYFETSDHEDSPSVVVRGPKDLFGSYSLNNGPASTKGTFPLKIHSISAGKHSLKLDVYTSYNAIASEFSINFPLAIESVTKNRLNAVKIISIVSIVTVVVFALFVTYRVTDMKRVKAVLHSLRSPTGIFTSKSPSKFIGAM